MKSKRVALKFNCTNCVPTANVVALRSLANMLTRASAGLVKGDLHWTSCLQIVGSGSWTPLWSIATTGLRQVCANW
jgi:hypothetical protein